MEENVETKRGKVKYVHNGFLYIFDKKSSDGSKKMWQCKRKDQQCKARLHSNAFTGELVRVVGNYTHDSDAARIEVIRTVNILKRRVTDTTEGTAQVINNCIGNLTQAAQGQLPMLESLKKVVRRRRNQVQAPLPMPATLQDLRIPQEYQLYEYQPGLFEPFLLAALEGQMDNILLFSRNTNLDLLERSKKWYIDGVTHFATTKSDRDVI